MERQLLENGVVLVNGKASSRYRVEGKCENYLVENMLKIFQFFSNALNQSTIFFGFSGLRDC
jgi:hypothetical protein